MYLQDGAGNLYFGQTLCLQIVLILMTLVFHSPHPFFWPKKIAQRQDKERNNIIKNKFISVKLAAGQKEMDLKGK